jgi:uncharacterized protein with beta-barrel porin domain
MSTIAPVSAATTTSSNWLEEAQDALAASANPGSKLGTLRNAKDQMGSIKSFLANSANTAGALALISQNVQASAGALAAQMASAGVQKIAADEAALTVTLNAIRENCTPPQPRDPILYFEDGASVDAAQQNFSRLANLVTGIGGNLNVTA